MTCVALFFQLGGDVDILSPFLTLSKYSFKTRVRLIVAEKLWQTNPRINALLEFFDAAPDHVLSSYAGSDDFRKALGSSSMLLTASETTLRPHALAHALTKHANASGVPTYTFQHGIENVGLTYFDEHQGAEVRFASSAVCLWNDPASLPAVVSDETRSKCICAGYADPEVAAFSTAVRELLAPFSGQPVIGVFENLHWTRFSAAYRQRFLDDLDAACDAFPTHIFLVKPHPEGRWLTERYKGTRPNRQNLVVADPGDTKWSLVTAPSLMPHLSAVITTPSKTALDAAASETPVAIASYDGPYPTYTVLPALRSLGDWAAFIERASFDRQSFRSANRLFTDTIIKRDCRNDFIKALLSPETPTDWPRSASEKAN